MISEIDTTILNKESEHLQSRQGNTQ